MLERLVARHLPMAHWITTTQEQKSLVLEESVQTNYKNVNAMSGKRGECFLMWLFDNW